VYIKECLFIATSSLIGGEDNDQHLSLKVKIDLFEFSSLSFATYLTSFSSLLLMPSLINSKIWTWKWIKEILKEEKGVYLASVGGWKQPRVAKKMEETVQSTLQPVVYHTFDMKNPYYSHSQNK